MSEKKVDTSSPLTLSQIKNNPLLSASVTGMLLDDFPNKPLLLPAAPPIVTTRPPAENSNNNKSSPTVTVGEAPDIDTEQFSEINLNVSLDDPVPFSLQSDVNDNPFPQIQHEPPAHSPSEFADESILSQAASSFSQLPSVASTVLSTFSKVINNYTPTSQAASRETSSERDILQNTQQQQHQQLGLDQHSKSDLFNNPIGQSATYPTTLTEPSTFFTPSDYVDNQKPPTPSQQLPPPLTVGTATGNTYRLTTRKKTYAQIPGLSKQLDHNKLLNQPVPSKSPNSFPPDNSNQSGYPPAEIFSQQLPTQTDCTVDDNNSISNSYTIPQVTTSFQQPISQNTTTKTNSTFSFSNIVPPVLQNITGFVKSTVTGNSEQPVQQSIVYQQEDPNQSNIHFFNSTAQQSVTASTVGFIQPEVNSNSITFFVPSEGNNVPFSSGQIGFESIQSTVNPPAVQTSAPPPKPPQVGGTSSFRLQKGTRLYKSPFEQNPVPSAPSIQSAFNLEPTISQPVLQVGEIFTPISQSGTIQHPPPSVVTGLPPLPPSEGGNNFFTPINTTSSFIEPSKQHELGQVPLFNPLNNQQNNLTPFDNKVQTTQIFNPINQPENTLILEKQIRETAQVYNPLNTQQDLLVSSRDQIPEHTQNFNPIDQQKIPGINQFFNPTNHIQEKSESIKVLNLESQPTSAHSTGNRDLFPLQSFEHQTESQSQIFNLAQDNSTLFSSQPSLANHQQAVAILNPVQETQSPASFSQQPTTFSDPVANRSQNFSSVPNFPPPPVEKPEAKEDKYDSVPLQPPSIDQKPVEPLSNQQGSNPFRRGAGLNNKLPKTVTPPTPVSSIVSSQFSEIAKFTPVNFFNPQESNQPADINITEEIIIANTINFPTEEKSGETESLSVNLKSSSIPENTNTNYSSATPIPQGNIKEIENLENTTTRPTENLQIDNNICAEAQQSPLSLLQSENIRTESSTINPGNTASFSNYFGFVSESTESNNFGTVNTSTLTEPFDTNTVSKESEQIPINQFSNFENQLIKKSENTDQIPQSLQSVQSASGPVIKNFFTANNENQLNYQLSSLQPNISPAEENCNNIQKNTPEKLENIQQNLFTNYFTSINQQHQNIEKQTDISTNLNRNLKQANILPKTDPSTFFDSFNNNSGNSSTIQEFNSGDNSNQIIEDPNSQRIQNFFNNPPPQNLGDSVNDLNYNFYGSGNEDIVDLKKDFLTTTNYNIETIRPSTPASNLVEPPSSACSEFSSDFSNSLAGQQQLLDYLKKLSTDELPDEIVEQLNMAKLIPSSANTQKNVIYQPAPYHWFFKKSIDAKQVWTPFSHKDSNELEKSFQIGDPAIIPVEGGRYDVNIKEKLRTPVYWNGDSTEVRRCSWFYKAIDSKYVPYDELTADLLESEYKNASNSGEWHKKVSLETGETVVFHGPTVIVHFLQSQIVDAWGGATQSQSRPRVVKRDLDDFIIEAGETNKVDHLLFMVHGIGSGCDLKFRSVEEVVEEFRSIAYQLVQSHYKNSCDLGEVGRVEVLPVSWHDELHSKESGIDEKLKAITLESIPRLRNFANDTVLDVLFYTSPVFCQNIINTVGNCMNRVFLKYCERNTDFSGQISLAGHSLGSLILFDLLCHQRPIEDNDLQNSENPDQISSIMPQMSNQVLNSVAPSGLQKQVSYTIGSAGTGQPFINYPQLLFAPKKFFALGSPIGMFVTIRGIDSLGLDFKLPTCPGFYNIFHPYDPVAYRVEALINPELSAARPVLIPHHKGRKRMHLELKETMTRVGTEVKQRIVDTFKNTMESVFFMAPKNTKTDVQEIEEEVDKVLEMQLKMEASTTRIRSESQSSNVTSEPEAADIDLPLGKLNDSKRIDYVLQEAPLEFFNEYLFALTSHVCYWESADTILFVVKEIYSSLGITTDSQIPQQTMSIERPNSVDIIQS